MKIQYGQTIEVTKNQYEIIVANLSGYIAHKFDKVNNKYLIKIWHEKAINLLERILKL